MNTSHMCQLLFDAHATPRATSHTLTFPPSSPRPSGSKRNVTSSVNHSLTPSPPIPPCLPQSWPRPSASPALYMALVWPFLLHVFPMAQRPIRAPPPAPGGDREPDTQKTSKGSVNWLESHLSGFYSSAMSVETNILQHIFKPRRVSILSSE